MSASKQRDSTSACAEEPPVHGYLLLNGIGWLVSLGLCLACVFAGVLPPFSTLWRQDPAWGLLNYSWWLVLVCLACQVIDAGVTWLKFAKKEDAQRLRESGRRC